MDLRIDGLTRRFGDRVAVEIPSLTIAGGELFTFVGPSGCGKSTLLNLIAGLDVPTAGTLHLDGRVLNDLPPHRRDVAFVFQSYALYPHRTVFGNLSFPLELAGLGRAEIGRRVEAAAALLGLVPLLGKRPRELSGGERQRVAVGRAIVRQPQLFLFDEPLSNLDAPLRAQMRRELKRLHQQLGRTFVYVTHDQEEALSLSDRVAVMQEGRIRQAGSPRDIYDRPASTFVASFFGTPAMNLLRARVEEADGGLALRIGDGLLDAGGLRVDPGREVLAGIRPEDVRLHGPAEGSGWAARIVSVEQHGGLGHVELETHGTRLVALDRADAGHTPGGRVRIELSAGRVHLFDVASGERL